MITRVDTLAWDAADLTGNAAIVNVGTDLYIAGGRREDDTQGLYRSTDYGLTWEVVHTLPAPAGTMDPAVVADGTTLHIIVGTPGANPLLMNVLHYSYDTLTDTLSSPHLLVEGSKAQAAYDIVALTGGGFLVVTAGLEAVGHEGKYALLAFEGDNLGATTETVIQETHWASGDTMGALSLVAQGGSAPEELFYTEHPRVFTFRDTTVSLQRRLRTAPGVWTDPVTLTTYGARFTDDKLTVVAAPNGDRLIAQAYHLQSKTYGSQTQILYGVGTFVPASSDWSWAFDTLAADGYSIFKEPVIGTDGVGTYLAYLVCQRNLEAGGYDRSGFLRVSDLNRVDLSLVTRVGAWASLRYKWLRGGKSPQDTESKWALVGIEGPTLSEIGGGPAFYLSSFNLAPQAVLKPTTLVAKRGVDYVLDASETIDPDLDSLTYTWTASDPDPNIHLFPFDSGKKAILRVDKTIGPAEVLFTVSVLADDGVAGHAALPQATATMDVTVPFNTSPVITLPASQGVVRNSTVTIEAQIEDVDADTLTILWEQVSGTPVVLSQVDQPVVTVEAYRMNPDGEAVVLQVSADDGVNPAVTAQITLNISAILDRDLDAGTLARAYYSVNQ